MTEAPAKEVRKYIFDYFLENCRAPVLEEVMRRFGLGREEAARALESLEVAHHVVRVPGTNRILMANPFSALSTPFRVRAGGKDYFSACAWDSVAFHVMLGVDVRVDSFCHHCAEPVQLSLSGGKLASSSSPSPLVYLSLPAAEWWDNIVATCANHMVFFNSRAHLDDWLKSNPGDRGEALSISQTIGISQPLYRSRMKLDYVRPAKEELMSHWGSMGLIGEFWRL
jgi:hypothetical protein